MTRLVVDSSVGINWSVPEVQNVPCIESPPRETKSTSRNPGDGSLESANVRTGTQARSSDSRRVRSSGATSDA
jgi:hypothetical protein